MSEIPMKSTKPKNADIALRDDILALFKRHLTPDTPERFLAIASQVVGQVIALQDQRRMTHDMIWRVVSANIEAGNRSVIENLHNTKGSA